MNELRLPKDVANRIERRWAARFGQSWQQQRPALLPTRQKLRSTQFAKPSAKVSSRCCSSHRRMAEFARAPTAEVN